MLCLVGFAACCLRESRLRRRTGLLKYADKIYIPLWREVHPKAKPVKNGGFGVFADRVKGVRIRDGYCF